MQYKNTYVFIKILYGMVQNLNFSPFDASYFIISSRRIAIQRGFACFTVHSFQHLHAQLSNLQSALQLFSAIALFLNCCESHSREDKF